MAQERVFSARWVLPVSARPMLDGVVVTAGDRIVAVGPRGLRQPDRHFGDAILIPGLVNAHTHLDLSGLRGAIPPTEDGPAWLRQVIGLRRALLDGDVASNVRQGIEECVRSGTTLVGDISGDGASWDVIAASPLRATVYRELIGLPKERAENAWRAAQAWLGYAQPTDQLRPGLSPHAPYSARVSIIRAASQAGVPIAIHLAEFEAERELLTDYAGPFRDFLTDLNAWEPMGLAKGPEHVLRLTATAPAIVYAHGNYLAPSAGLPEQGAIVYCPRTHAAFGHPVHPLLAFHHRGVRVALGTDSLASNPDLNVLEEARYVLEVFPELTGLEVLRMVTLAAAEAIGWADACGSLEPGKFADFVVLPLPPDADGDDPFRPVLMSESEPTHVMVGGISVFPSTES